MRASKRANFHAGRLDATLVNTFLSTMGLVKAVAAAVTPVLPSEELNYSDTGSETGQPFSPICGQCVFCKR